MKTRLAASVLKLDIFICDEFSSVGDEKFQKNLKIK
jgi:ABC-type polysaccharide/polyol phosphate transport system ATPase subunit